MPIAAARPTDRRVVVWAQSVPTEACDPAVLAAALAMLAAPAR